MSRAPTRWWRSTVTLRFTQTLFQADPRNQTWPRRECAAFSEAAQLNDHSLLSLKLTHSPPFARCAQGWDRRYRCHYVFAIGNTCDSRDSMDFGFPLIVAMNLDDRLATPSYLVPSFPSMRAVWVCRGVVSICCHGEASRFPSLSLPLSAVLLSLDEVADHSRRSMDNRVAFSLSPGGGSP